MDPGEGSSSVDGGGHVRAEQRGCDPPEEAFEMKAFPSSSLYHNNSGIRAILNGADDQLDDYEMEGLIMTSNSRRSSFSSVGTGSSFGNSSRLRANAAQNALFQHCAPVLATFMTLFHLAWEPRNRSRSAIALIFFAFLCFVLLTENDASVSHRSSSGHTNKKPRNNPLSNLTPNQRLSLLKRIYGSWNFYDGSAEDRPKTPYMTVANAGNPYLDLSEDKFPEESWQADAVYANHFLDAATKLVKRGQQAIFSTYHGYGMTDVSVVLKTGEETIDYTREEAAKRSTMRAKMFQLEDVDLSYITSAMELQEAAPEWERKGGWTTERSMDGLERRLTHAIMTNSDFTVLFTGGWESMGYGGNHAWQSMPAVFETLLKGLFEKLGVNLVVRTIGLPPLDGISLEEQMEILEGGKQTLVHTLGWSSIYGSDVDMVVWDDYSSIDDGEAHPLDELSTQLFDLFARQALLSGNTSLPFIWGGDFEVLRNLHEHADVDVGQLGNGLSGVPETTSEKAASDLPWAAQYLNCPGKMQKMCEKEEYQFESRCWVERSDFTPPTSQLDHIPILSHAIGWRKQQLKGYSIAYVFLSSLLNALDKFSEITISFGFPLPDEHWHMGEYIENVQEKIKKLDESHAPHCFQLQEKMNLPKRMCQQKMSAFTEFTPRANPAETSLRTLIDYTQVPKTTPQPVYKGDDAKNHVGTIPFGEVDALEIFDLNGKVSMARMLNARNVTSIVSDEKDDAHRKMYAITKGEGWQLQHSNGDGCDGYLSSSALCGRIEASDCLLEGHQGSRGGILGSKSTGWLVLFRIRTENGFVSMNLDFGGPRVTGRALHESLPDSFSFEYAIEGAITTLKKPQFLEAFQQPVPGVGFLVVFDDDKISEPKDVVVSIRIEGCDENEECQFALTHVYYS